MKYNELGQSGIKVSELCLGTMTWGSQNSQEDANRQIDISLDHGINFLDTAEMYPATPRSSKTQGDTERIIGNWLKSNNRRSDIILATKITGKGFNSIRNGNAISVSNLKQALCKLTCTVSGGRVLADQATGYKLAWHVSSGTIKTGFSLVKLYCGSFHDIPFETDGAHVGMAHPISV